MNKTNPLRVFYAEHKLLAISLTAIIIILLIVIAIITLNSGDNDGVMGDDSRAVEASIKEDQKALERFPITNYLPIISKDPAYTISYILDKNEESSEYSIKLSLSAFSASAREAMVKRFLSEDFGGADPLTFDIIIENYYNPFTSYSLDDIKSGELPENFTKNNLYVFGDSTYTVQTLTHTLYDGSTNTYRYVLENGEPKTIPALFYTYKDLPFLSESQVVSLNTLE